MSVQVMLRGKEVITRFASSGIGVPNLLEMFLGPLMDSKLLWSVEESVAVFAMFFRTLEFGPHLRDLSANWNRNISA